MADNKITVDFELDESDVVSGFKNVSSAAQNTFGDITKGVFAGQLAYDAFKKTIGFVVEQLKESVRASAESSDAVNRFNQALASTGQYSKEASESFQEYASSLETMTRFSDEAILSSASLIQTIAKLDNETMKSATDAALDLATAYGIDLDSASRLIGKAAEGNISAFSRLGIEIEKGKNDAETFANTLQALSHISGAAARDANTFSGALAILNNVVDAFRETIGDTITKSGAIRETFKFVASEIVRFTSSLKEAGDGKDFFKPLILGAIDFGLAINTVVLKPLELFYNFGKVVFDVIRTMIQTVVVDVGYLGEALTLVLNKVGLASDETLANMTNFKDAAVATFQDFEAQTAESTQNLFSFETTSGIEEFALRYQTAIESAKMSNEELVQNNKTSFQEITDTQRQAVTQIENIIKNGLVKSISTGIQTVITNVRKGQNAFQALGSQIFNIMGDMAITIGETLLLTGLGMEAVRASIVGLTGGPAIFAGIALIALGSLLKSLSGGGGESSGASSGGGGGSTSSSSSAPSANDFNEADVLKNKGTEVIINIQGNVLDRRETGLELVSIINEAFDSQGISTARA